MSHLEFIARVFTIVVLLNSPLLIFILYRDWRQKRLRASVTAILAGVPAGAAIVYCLLRYGTVTG